MLIHNDYYLSKLGIESWFLRVAPSYSFNYFQLLKSDKTLGFLILEAELEDMTNDKSIKLLLKGMLKTIGASLGDAASLSCKEKLMQADFIISIGKEAALLARDHHLKVEHIVEIPHSLSELLECPSLKKLAWKELRNLYLKN